MTITFSTFGELLRYLRQRAALTQDEFGLAVGYSRAHVARLESNQRAPDPMTVRARFVEALHLGEDPAMAARLLALAEAAHNESPLEENAAGSAAIPSTGAYSLAAASFPNNLPVQLTSFVGREREITEVMRLLGETRLLTLIGAGGAGKTRLAIEVAASIAGLQPCKGAKHRPMNIDGNGTTGDASPLPMFADGVWLVELATVTEPILVPDTVLTALGLTAHNRPPQTVLTDHLQDRHALLLLDNCEHLIEGCAALVIKLLQTCPYLRILAISREPLDVPGETTWRIPSLTPSEGEVLFVERARTAKPGFTITPANAGLISQICTRLDNMPLALELAAARLRAFSVEQIAARLDDAFRVLTGGSRMILPRQQTLQATIDWSYELLSGKERALFRLTSVFVGGWTLEAVEAIHGPDALDLLEQLVNKSLVVAEESEAGMRYHLLEVIRQYAHARLVAEGEETGARQRHMQYYVDLSQQADIYPYFANAERMQWENILLANIDNLLAAFRWIVQSGAWQTVLPQVEEPLTYFLVAHSYANEVEDWIDQAILPNTELTASTQLAGIHLKVESLTVHGNMTAPIDWQKKALSLAVRLQDELLICRELRWLGLLTADYKEASTLLHESIHHAQEAGAIEQVIAGSMALGQLMWMHGDYESAAAIMEKYVAMAHGFGNQSLFASSLWRLGQLWLARGEYAKARALLEECISIFHEHEWPNYEREMVDLGTACLYLGDVVPARRAVNDSIVHHYKADNLERVAQAMVLAAGVAHVNGDPYRAARLLGAVAAIRREHHTHGVYERELFGEYDVRLPAVRAALDPADFERAWAAGERMTLRQAMDEAMSI